MLHIRKENNLMITHSFNILIDRFLIINDQFPLYSHWLSPLIDFIIFDI